MARFRNTKPHPHYLEDGRHIPPYTDVELEGSSPVLEGLVEDGSLIAMQDAPEPEQADNPPEAPEVEAEEPSERQTVVDEAPEAD